MVKNLIIIIGIFILGLIIFGLIVGHPTECIKTINQCYYTGHHRYGSSTYDVDCNDSRATSVRHDCVETKQKPSLLERYNN